MKPELCRKFRAVEHKTYKFVYGAYVEYADQDRPDALIEKYDNVSIGQPIGMSVYNAIIDLFNEKLRPFFEDYDKLKKEVE